MNKRILCAVIAGVMCASLATGCNEKDVDTNKDKETAEKIEETAGTNVTVEEAQLRNVENKATYTGSLITNNFAYVTSKVSAKVKDINAEIGDWVNEGDVLIKLDSTDYEYQLSQAKASYAQAEAAYNSALTALNNVGGASEQSKVQLEQAVASAKLAYDNAKTNLDRQTELYNMGAISLATYEGAQIQCENARLAYESAKKNLEIVTGVIVPGNEDSAKSGVETAKAAMNAASLAISQAQSNIENTTITAPISGYVSAKNIAAGQFAAAGNPLFTVSNSENLEVEINVTEAVIPYVSVGGKAVVSVSSATAEKLEGVVTVVNPVKDQMTGMYAVRVSVPNEGLNLKIGMIADVTLVTSKSIENAVSIPEKAILQAGEEYYVFVVNDEKAEKRVITLGVTDGEYRQVTEGIEEGDLVVVEGKEYLSEKNNLVNIVE